MCDFKLRHLNLAKKSEIVCGALLHTKAWLFLFCGEDTGARQRRRDDVRFRRCIIAIEERSLLLNRDFKLDKNTYAIGKLLLEPDQNAQNRCNNFENNLQLENQTLPSLLCSHKSLLIFGRWILWFRFDFAILHLCKFSIWCVWLATWPLNHAQLSSFWLPMTYVLMKITNLDLRMVKSVTVLSFFKNQFLMVMDDGRDRTENREFASSATRCTTFLFLYI